MRPDVVGVRLTPSGLSTRDFTADKSRKKDIRYIHTKLAEDLSLDQRLEEEIV